MAENLIRNRVKELELEVEMIWNEIRCDSRELFDLEKELTFMSTN